MKDKFTRGLEQVRKRLRIGSAGIQMSITLSFTVIAGIGMILLGIILYSQFSVRTQTVTTENAGQFLGQTKRSTEDYLRSMRRISDALYFSSIKNKDLKTDSMDPEFSLLYEANKDDLVSIALYTEDGDLVSAVPVSARREGVNVTEQSWFTDALDTVENLHFSLPHVQNLFEETPGRYHWVISMSRAVELNRGGLPEQGVLLIDMNFSGIQQLLEKANSDSTSEYIYLCSSRGDIIYHPRMSLINAGLYSEDNLAAAGRTDGTYLDFFEGRNRTTIVRTVSYTGWKLISVIPHRSYSMGMGKSRYFVVLVLAFLPAGR